MYSSTMYLNKNKNNNIKCVHIHDDLKIMM